MLEALQQEMTLQKDYLKGATIDTIYIGGGTPSLLSSEELLQLFDALYLCFPAQELKEITLEANPDDLNLAYLRALRQTPVNRLSIGVQSFREADLRYMHRAHTATQADYAIKAAQDTGFDNLSLDLIYGTPGLSDTHWINNLKTAINLKAAHISSYALTVEPRTALAHQIAKGITKAPDNEQSAGQFEILMAVLEEHGYDHYEISNFSLPGKHALHNTSYWQGASYLGLGPSAHSYDGNSRQWNVAGNGPYMQRILKDREIPCEREMLSVNDRLNEYLMTSLRTKWGCDLNYITQTFGEDTAKNILKMTHIYVENGQMRQDNQVLILTTSGKLLADGIAAALFRV